MAWSVPSVPPGQSCVPYSQTRTCINGVLNGSYPYNYCGVQCSFHGVTVEPQASVTAYQSDNVPPGQTCQSEQRTCSNGALTGSYAFPACTVAFSGDGDLLP